MKFIKMFRKSESVVKSFSREETQKIAEKLKIDFSKEKFNFNEFFMGVNVELEH